MQELAERTAAKTDLFPRQGLYSPSEGQQGAANGECFRVVTKGCPGFWTAGCWLARQLHRPDSSTDMDLGTKYSFPYFYSTCRLENLGPVDQNGSEHDFSALLLRALAMSRRHQSESIEVALVTE